MNLDVRPLHPALGAEILGIDLHEDLSAEVLGAIEAVWKKYNVVVFRNQTWNDDDQRRFARFFGDVQFPHTDANSKAELTFIGNAKPEGSLPDGEMVFHQDSAYREQPTRATMLYAIEVPSSGGDTRFASTINAYALLEPELRERILGYDIFFNFDVRDYKQPNRANWSADLPSFTHPLVIRHESGRPLLFCNRLMADHIAGLPAAESRKLIDHLCEVLESPANIYDHAWRVGDVVLWDNLGTAHGRTDFDPSERRWMRRSTVLGPRPVAYRDVIATARV